LLLPPPSPLRGAGQAHARCAMALRPVACARSPAAPGVVVSLASRPSAGVQPSSAGLGHVRAAAAAVAASAAVAQQAATRQRLQKLARCANGQGAPPSADDAKDGPFSDVFAKVLKGGAPLLVDGGQVKLDVGPGAQSEGLSVKWGLLKERAPTPDNSAEARAERARLRAEAAEDLVNIDGPERERRALAGNAMTVVTVLLIVGLLAGQAPWFARAGLLPVFVLAYGYRMSADEGL